MTATTTYGVTIQYTAGNRTSMTMPEPSLDALVDMISSNPDGIYSVRDDDGSIVMIAVRHIVQLTVRAQ